MELWLDNFIVPYLPTSLAMSQWKL